MTNSLATTSLWHRELESLRSRNRALTQQAIDLQRSETRQVAPLPVSFPSSATPSPELAKARQALQEAERRATEGQAENASLKQQVVKLQGASLA